MAQKCPGGSPSRLGSASDGQVVPLNIPLVSANKVALIEFPQAQRSWLKFRAPLNMLVKSTTLLTSQADKFWLKTLAL